MKRRKKGLEEKGENTEMHFKKIEKNMKRRKKGLEEKGENAERR